MSKRTRASRREQRKLIRQVLEMGQRGLEKTAQEAGTPVKEMPWSSAKFGACMVQVRGNPPRVKDGHKYDEEDSRKICAAEMWFSVGLGPHVRFDHRFKKMRRLKKGL